MKKRIILIGSIVIILIVIILSIFLIKNKKDKKFESNENINFENFDPYFYNVNNKKAYAPEIIYEFLYYSDFENVPVTKKFANKFKDVTISKYYNIEKYSIENRQEYDDNICYFICCKERKGSDPLWIKKIGFKYYLDSNGFLDDIELVSEDIYRDDEGNLIPKPNRIKFLKSAELPRNHIDNIIYGIDYIAYKVNDFKNEYYAYDQNFDEMMNSFKEFALSDNFKNKYNQNNGLLFDNIKNFLYKNKYDFDIIIKDEYYSYELNNIVPIKIVIQKTPYSDDRFEIIKNGTEIDCELITDYYNLNYDYNLHYSITDDGFLDDIYLEESN